MSPRIARTAVPSLLGALLALPLWADGDQPEDFLQLLNTKVVSASKTWEKVSKAPATVIVITRQEIEQRGYVNFWEIFDDLPGFDLVLAYGDTFLKPYARGFRNNIGDSFLILVDGQVFNHIWFNATWVPLAAMPLSNIDHVEVVYGPASAVYGSNAFMGVVNVVTVKVGDTGTSGRVDLIGGSLDKGGADFTLRLPLNQWKLSVTGRFYQGDMDAKVGNQYEYSSDKYLGNAALGRQIYGRMLGIWGTEGNSPYSERAADIRLSRGATEFGIQHLGLKSGYGRNYAADRYLPASSTWYQLEWAFWAQHSLELSPNLTSKALVRYRRSDISNESLDFEVAWDKGLKAFVVGPQHWPSINSALTYTQDFEYKHADFLNFNFGLVVSHEDMEKGYEFSNTGLGYLIPTATFDTSLIQPRTISDLTNANHIGIERRGAYLQSRIELDANQNLVLGVRRDWHSIFGGATTFRSGYTGNWEGLAIKALYGQGYQEPSHRQFFGGWQGAGSSTGLKPERSNTSEFSVGYTQPAWSALADLYDIRNSNTILTVSGGAQNLGTQHIVGMDLHGRLRLHQLLDTEWNLWGYYTHNFLQEGSPYNAHLNVAGSDEIGDIDRNKLWLGLTATLPKQITWTLKGRHFGERKTIATNPLGRIPGYTVVESYAQIGGLFLPGFHVGLKISNASDAAYSAPGLRDADAGEKPATFDANGDYQGSAGYYASRIPQAGRSFSLILRYRF